MNAKVLGMVSLAALLTGPVQAEVTGEVIAAHLYYGGGTALMSALDGKQYAEVACQGDLSHGGPPRYFLTSSPSAVMLPDGYQGSELVAATEDCSLSLIILSEPGMRFSTTPAWSPDGTQIASYAERWDLPSGSLVERGVFVMDVVRAGSGVPTGTANLRIVVAMEGEGALAWCGDQALVYHAGVPDGLGGSQTDLFVFDMELEESINLTDTPDVSELVPVCSPVDDRVAYYRLMQVRGSYRYDVFTLDMATGVVRQVTSKKTTGTSANRHPQFSPDGQYLSFSSGTLAPFTAFDIYKIRSDGSGKAVNLTARKDGDYRWHVWRD